MNEDTRYLDTILDCVRVCANYKPKFGLGTKEGLTLREFQDLYRDDTFYNWFGLDNPRMYVAHRAGGAMTSIYRQIGIGCEKVFRDILQDTFQLSNSDVVWSYETFTADGKKKKLSLDARVPLGSIRNSVARERFMAWMERSAESLGVEPNVFNSLTGTVFEVRQGYKSRDSKRQNADIANAANAYIKSYLPCAVILSNQIDDDILRRYRAEKWVVVTGVTGQSDPLASTYDFMREVVGFDLAGFFERNAPRLREEMDKVLQTLLEMGGP